MSSVANLTFVMTKNILIGNNLLGPYWNLFIFANAYIRLVTLTHQTFPFLIFNIKTFKKKSLYHVRYQTYDLSANLHLLNLLENFVTRWREGRCLGFKRWSLSTRRSPPCGSCGPPFARRDLFWDTRSPLIGTRGPSVGTRGPPVGTWGPPGRMRDVAPSHSV